MLEDHWLPQPDLRLTLEDEAQLQDIWELAKNSNATWLESLPVPKWKFLNWLVARHAVLLHGSGDADITLFEPRRPNDRSADDFSKQTAVFAASDGIWPIFYAILDRQQTGLRYLNAALRFELEPGSLTSMHYFFSVTQEALNRGPWRDGCVYILPGCGFIQQPPYELEVAWFMSRIGLLALQSARSPRFVSSPRIFHFSGQSSGMTTRLWTLAPRPGHTVFLG